MGAGAAIALCCDLRYGTPTLSSACRSRARSATASRSPTLARLVDAVGPARAKELIFLARLVGAEEARAAGPPQRDRAAGEPPRARARGGVGAGPPTRRSRCASPRRRCAGSPGRPPRESRPTTSSSRRTRARTSAKASTRSWASASPSSAAARPMSVALRLAARAPGGGRRQLLLADQHRLPLDRARVPDRPSPGRAAGADASSAGFPASLFLTLVGITLLVRAGARQRHARQGGRPRGAARARQRRHDPDRLLPARGVRIATIGAGNIAATALLAPVAMGIAGRGGHPRLPDGDHARPTAPTPAASRRSRPPGSSPAT